MTGDSNVVDTSSGDAAAGDILTGKKAWVDGNEVTGNVSAGSDVTGPDGQKTFTIPDGIYSGSKTATANDSDLVPANIRSGVEIFGVTGEVHGGCTCANGTLNGTRWCDNGDGTVTDLTTCLVWLKKADWGGQKKWVDCATYDDAHTRVGILRAGVADANLSDGSGEGDWRLPTEDELYGLSGPPEAVTHDTMRAFTGVRWEYWSSTTLSTSPANAFYIYMSRGDSSNAPKQNYSFSVWPVRIAK